MEFWLENQGQSQLYSRFGTLPGRNCAHNYLERRQATYNTLYYGEQQDQGRESSCWTVPASRAGRALQEYTNWTEPELAGCSSPNFPFSLHRHDQRHQDLGEYRSHNPRDREWPSHGPVRDNDRGFLRDAWPKRWDQSHPSRYNRDVSAKRNDSSYRELEAWAARYSHSLPRRRRLEAELREAIQGTSESSRVPEREKLVTNPGVQQQHCQLNRNSRAPGLWDKTEPRAVDTNHMKGNTEYQSRVLGKPPGYIGPPPYNRPHKNSPVMHHCNFGWQLVGKKQADWSQPTLRKQDVPVDLQNMRKVEKDISKGCPELEELKSSKQQRDAIQGPSTTDAQKPEVMLAQETQAVQKSNMEKEEICKVIEGRKFRLKKKTGGMTIFCLVSRIASPSETTSLPVCTSQTSIQSTETRVLSKDRQDSHEVNKLSDDVDFRAHTLKEQSDKKTPQCKEMVMLKDDLPNNSVFPEKSERSAPQSVEPVLTKYPLWREPSSSTKPETESFNTNCLKETKRSILNQAEGEDVSSHSTDIEKKKLDIAENIEDMRGLLVIDTSCVVVKVEMIPSPQKEHVHYLGSTANDESRTSESSSQVYQDVTIDQSNEALQRYEDSAADFDPTLLKKQEHRESDISLSGVQSPSLSERETLKERAKRILGIPLHDDEQQTDEEPLIDLCKEDQNEEAEPPHSEQTLEDTEDHVEVLLVNKDDIRKQLASEDGKYVTEFQQPATNMTEDNNTESQLQTDNNSTQTELKKDNRSEFTCGESENEEHLVDLSNTSSLSPNLSDLSMQEGLDSELDAQSADVDLTPHPDASPPPVMPPPLILESPDSPLSCTLNEEHLPSPPPLEVIFQAADGEHSAKPKDDEGEILQTAESGVNNESLVTEIKEVLPHQHNEYHQCDNAPCVAEKQQTDEDNSSRAETKNENLSISAHQLRCAQTEGVTCAKEEQYPQVSNGSLSDPTVQTGEENEENARTSETEDYHFLPKYELEKDVSCKKERDVTLEPCQNNPDLNASPLEQTRSNERDEFTQTQLNTDILQTSESQGPDYASSSSCEVLNKLLISDFSSPPQEPDRDCAPLLETQSTGSLLNVDITAAPDIVENTSSPFYLDSCEESSQLTTFLSQEEDISPKFSLSSAQKRGSQHPKSLLDVVNRIRKHTAPDSESEEEEVREQWDPSCPDMVADTKSEENFTDELQVVLKDSTETGQVDQDDKDDTEEDTLSCSSHVSEDAVIVGGEETRLSGEVDKEKEESDVAEGELRCSSEEKDETQSEESKEEENLNICSSSVESPVELDQDASDMLN
ncbi:uncharacterized protein FYW61_003048 [Anableps anableps]